MDLDHLAKATDALDEDAFLKAHPHPALVFTRSAPGTGEKMIHTPPSGVYTKRDTILSASQESDKDPPTDRVQSVANRAPGTVPPPGEHDTRLPERESAAAYETGARLGKAQVWFLEKTSKNPFADMLTVGRATNNDVCLPLTSVSKLHAYFLRDPSGNWRIRDGRSTNGTFVDGTRLSSGGMAPLANGTCVGFGPDVQARFYSPQDFFGFLALRRAGVA